MRNIKKDKHCKKIYFFCVVGFPATQHQGGIKNE